MMAINFGARPKPKVIGQLRRTQLVTTFGSGAIVDMLNYSVIIAATDYWNKNSKSLHEPNLERLLKVAGFKQPYVSENIDGEYKPDILAFRFPTMHFCPNCGRLMPYWGVGNVLNNVCNSCKREIVPSRFIAACVNGHLEDFPYSWWVHNGDFSACPNNALGNNLKITFSDEIGGLESIIITCNQCGKSRSMAGSMSKDALKGYRCRGKRPWLGQKAKHNDPVACSATLRGLQRGASNIYFAQTVSALTIPPWSSKLHQAIDRNWDDILEELKRNPDKNGFEGFIRGKFTDLLRDNKYIVDNIIHEIQKRQQGDGRNYIKKDLYEDEYHVFSQRNYDKIDDVQFRIQSTDVPDFLADYIEDVIMVRRLREVLALRGFRRILPEKAEKGDERFLGYHIDGDCVPLSSSNLNWYPAIEMLGEGIFIKIKEEALQQWEEKNKDYYKPMQRRLEASHIECDNFSPRYVLLHTISHLLIRQMAVECGYSGASIKERIYSTYPDSAYKMAGILIYTSSSDSDGSLGGLVRNALPESFGKVFLKLLQEASWCASDPICIESKAQGCDSLNYAACHACTLLPETSCNMRNCLLDRGAVVGSIFDRARGFFGSLVE
jgi:hypothetical protein